MKAGKIASLCLVLVLTIVAGLVCSAAIAGGWLDALSPTARLSLIFGVLGLSIAAILMPFGIILDRSLEKIRRAIQVCAESDEQSLTIAGVTCSG